MAFNLIVSQGRAADQSARTIEGAALTAKALETRFGARAITVGKPLPPADDDWSESLPQARNTLIAVRDEVEKSIQSGKLTVLVSNTCSISLASLPVMARSFPDAVLLWIDAHGDFNTPSTTASGYLGGMVVSAACGLWDSGHGAGLNPAQIIAIGTRDVDTDEEKLMREHGVTIFPSLDAAALLEAIGDRKVWIHIDWDVMEPGYIPADYDVPGGLLPSQIRSVFETLKPEQILGLELAEYGVPDDIEASNAALHTIIEIVSPFLGRLQPASA